MRSREHAISFFHGCAEVVLEMELEVLESRSVFRIWLPAIQHDLTEGVGASWGRGHAIALLHLGQNLSVCHSRVRNLAVCDELGDENAKQPRVRLDTETVVQCGFGCCPLDEELGPFPCRVDIVQHNPR